jgi:hypothetical protein
MGRKFATNFHRALHRVTQLPSFETTADRFHIFLQLPVYGGQEIPWMTAFDEDAWFERRLTCSLHRSDSASG